MNLARKELNSVIGHLRHIVRRAVHLSNLTLAVECLTATAEARIFRDLQIQHLYTMSIPPSSYATMSELISRHVDTLRHLRLEGKHVRELLDGPHLPPIHLDSIAGPVSYVADALSRCNNSFPEIELTDDIHCIALTRLRGHSVNFDIRKLTIDLAPYECSAMRELPECFPQLQCFNITEKVCIMFMGQAFVMLTADVVQICLRLDGRRNMAICIVFLEQVEAGQDHRFIAPVYHCRKALVPRSRA